MAKQYWIGEFFVDLSRNQISQPGQSQTLPPKALLVLTHLAENRGNVVSYDELLDKVWPDTVVTPNTLQRSIAQLRKALGENSKVQSVIKTHAKQGYSLECEVKWSNIHSVADTRVIATSNTPGEATTPSEDEIDTQIDSSANRSEFKYTKTAHRNYYWMLAVVATVAVVAVLVQFQHSAPRMQLGDLRYLTATDDKEFGGTYSSDGRYILFRRYLKKGCINNIWAKDAETLEEFQLTSELGNYGQNSLSADGKTLVFIKQQDCTRPVNQTICYKLMSLNFNQALLRPQTPTERLDCQNSSIRKPVWIDDQHIAILQSNGQYWRLIRYSMRDNSSSTLYETETRIISYAWSKKKQLFAITSIKNDGQQYIEMLSPDGQIRSSHPIRLPQSAPRHQLITAEFIPNTEQLIFSDGSGLYTLSYEGDVNRAHFQPDEGVGAPYFHPDGKRLLLIKGTYDSDVARLSVPETSLLKQQEHAAEVATFERSINHEDIAKFHPHGNQVAFVSARTGSEQIWLQGEEGTKAISDFPNRPFIINMLWDDEGKSLLVLADLELHQLFLNKERSSFSFPKPVADLFHWDSNRQEVIANILVNGITQFVTIDLRTLEYRPINNKKVIWAAKSRDDDSLVFMDHMNRFWRKTAIEDQLLAPLTGQLAMKQRFVLSDQWIYGINKANQLWSYNLQSDAFDILTKVSPDIDYLTDVRGNELLATLVIAAKKEVVELSLSNSLAQRQGL